MERGQEDGRIGVYLCELTFFRMLRKQLDELREEKSKVQMNNAKLAAKVCVCAWWTWWRLVTVQEYRWKITYTYHICMYATSLLTADTTNSLHVRVALQI